MAEDINRLKTGISGMDDLLCGGIPDGSCVLLVGTAGAGKSLFSMQFLVGGTMDNEPGLYISFEEDKDSMIRNAATLGIDLSTLVEQNKLRIVKYDPYIFDNIGDVISSNIKQMGAKRVVIDSVSAVNTYLNEPREIRKTMTDIKNALKENGCTSLLISEVPADNIRKMSRIGIEEFVADGIIILYYTLSNTEYIRSVTVWKMRATSHSRKIHPFKISEKGISVYSKEEAFVKL